MPLGEYLAFAIPDVAKCRDAAEKLRAAHPDASAEHIARQAIAHAKNWAMTSGAATGVFSSPLTMIPAALADMSAMLRIEGALAGTIAALLDPRSLDDPLAFEADVLTILFPAAISQALRQVGVRVAQVLTRQMIRKHLVEGLFESAARIAGKRLMMGAGERALTKAVPIVGAGIGAGWNWVEIHAVGARAIRYYQTGELLEGTLKRFFGRFLPRREG